MGGTLTAREGYGKNAAPTGTRSLAAEYFVAQDVCTRRGQKFLPLVKQC